MCAKCQRCRLIFIFISCEQLLSAVVDCSAVEIFWGELDSHIGPKVGLWSESQLDWLIGGSAGECNGRQTDMLLRGADRVLGIFSHWGGG